MQPTPDEETRGHSSPIVYFWKSSFPSYMPVAWSVMYAFGDWLMYGSFKARNTFGVFLVLFVVCKQGKGACRERVHTHTHITSHGAHVGTCIVYGTIRCGHKTIKCIREYNHPFNDFIVSTCTKILHLYCRHVPCDVMSVYPSGVFWSSAGCSPCERYAMSSMSSGPIYCLARKSSLRIIEALRM